MLIVRVVIVQISRGDDSVGYSGSAYWTFIFHFDPDIQACLMIGVVAFCRNCWVGIIQANIAIR